MSETRYSFFDQGEICSEFGSHSQPNSHPGVKPRLLKAMPPIALVSREDQEALEKKLETMTRHDQNLLILKNFLKVNQEKKGGIEGVFLATSFPTDANRVEERVKKMATSLARVSLRQWMFAGLHRWEEKFSSDFYVRFEESSFKSFAKFILHMTDMEDLERVNLYDKLGPEYRKFYDENLKHLKSDENPFKLVAKGKINFDGFPLLREQDVGKVLLRHIRDTVIGQVGSRLHVVGWMPFGLQGYADSCFEERCNGRFVELARTVLLQYVLMEDVKIHSILDCHVCPHDCTFNAFRREAVFNVVEILESGKYMNHELASSIDFSLSLLINDRRRFVKWTSFIAANVLTFGPFGSFSKEVFDLVNIADARRRFQAHRFISKHHILWAVGLTRYKCFVDRLVESIGLRNVVEEPATCPSYSVYMSARITANIRGVEVVRVEHVVVATIFEIHTGKHRKNIHKFNSVGCVRKFLDDVRNYNKKSDDRSSSISS